MEMTPLNPFSRMISRVRQMRCLRIAAAAAVVVAAMVAQPSDGMAQPRPAELAANSRVIIDYIDPRLPRSEQTLDRLRKRQVLEELSMFLSPLRLPRMLRVRTKSCGQVNAFYTPSEWAISLCYEYYENLEAIAPQGTSPQGYTRDEVIVGGFIDAIFHELGHAALRHAEHPRVRARGGRRRPAVGLPHAAIRQGRGAHHHPRRGVHLSEFEEFRARGPSSPTSTAQTRSASSTMCAWPMAANRRHSGNMSIAACCRKRARRPLVPRVCWFAARSAEIYRISTRT